MGNNLMAAHYYPREYEKASITLLKPLDPPVDRGQLILLYLLILNAYLTFSHPCSFPVLLGEVCEAGSGQCAWQKIKEGGEL